MVIRMRRVWMWPFLAFVVACAADQGSASVIDVGPTQRLRLPSQAAAIARTGDTIRIAPGEYTDCAIWRASGLTIEGTGPGATIAGKSCAGKGIFIIDGNDVTVRNLTFAYAAVADRNGAGIRAEGHNLTVENSHFIDNFVEQRDSGRHYRRRHNSHSQQRVPRQRQMRTAMCARRLCQHDRAARHRAVALSRSASGTSHQIPRIAHGPCRQRYH